MQDEAEQGMGQKKGVRRRRTPSQRAQQIIDRVMAIAETVPPLYRGIFERAVRGTASPRSAIKAKCQECCGYEELKIRVGGCSTIRCPLHAYRPYREDANV